MPHTDTAFYRPLRNPLIDLNDMHQYAFPNTGEQHLPDWRIKTSFDVAQNFRNNYPAGATKKPFGHGEYSYSTNIVAGPPGHTESYEIEKFFHNYDVSFHNELWGHCLLWQLRNGPELALGSRVLVGGCIGGTPR
ncbi:MAG: hypothetical protein H6592_07465 [Flavobacteriales bacterium]|nr:hypothetical protein [Flavobacteriales bacterium]